MQPRLRSIAYGLLQHCSRRCTQVTYWQAPASSERRCSCRQQHAKVRPRIVWVTAWRTALVGYIPQRVDYKLCVTVHRCLQRKAPPYLADLCTPVSDIASRQHLYVRLEARCSTSPSHAVRPSGLLCCGSDGLKRTRGSVNLLFQTLSEDSSFLLLLAHQRIRGFAFMRYINPWLILIDWYWRGHIVDWH